VEKLLIDIVEALVHDDLVSKLPRFYVTQPTFDKAFIMQLIILIQFTAAVRTVSSSTRP
jgi:hypothetical protein